MEIRSRTNLLLIMVLMICISFLGCEKKRDNFHIGILQWTENIDAFNLTCKGAVAGLSLKGFKKGENLRISYINVEQDQSKAVETAERFVSEKVDLILTLGTGSSLAALSATETSKIPIIYSMVAAPKYAGVIDSYDDSGKNISGVTMRVPAEVQFEVLESVLPEMKSIGIIYCTETPPAVGSGHEAEAAAPKFGWRVETVSFPEEELPRLEEVVKRLAQKVDAIYIPSDPILTSTHNLDIINRITDSYNIPVISVVVDSVQKGRALMAFHCDFYEMGKQASGQIEKVINGINVQSIPSQVPVIRRLSLSLKKAKKLNITLSRNVILQADNIYE